MSAEPYLNAEQAARYVGYEPGQRNARGQDPQMRCFYAFIKRRKVTPIADGRRLLFRREDLDHALGREPRASTSSLDEMRELAAEHARGGWPELRKM
jgi:hypothetical protein